MAKWHFTPYEPLPTGLNTAEVYGATDRAGLEMEAPYPWPFEVTDGMGGELLAPPAEAPRAAGSAAREAREALPAAGAGNAEALAAPAGDGGEIESGTPGVLYVRTTSYYYFGGQRVAMRQTSSWGENVVYYLVTDHLGTTSLVLCGNVSGCDGVPNGGRVAESRHYPYGAVRWVWPVDESTFPTDYRFTGQRSVGLGLTHMGARFLDSSLGRWISPDSIVPNPQNPQSLNRYFFVLANPLKYRDPTGHLAEGEDNEGDLDLTLELLLLDEEDLYWYLHNTNSQWEILGFTAAGLAIVAAGPLIAMLTVEAYEALLASGTAVKVGKAVVEEAIESQVTGRPFDLINVALDAATQVVDEAYTAWRYGVCFAAGTLVASEAGPVAIESVQEGYLVYALTSSLSSSDLYTVTDVFSHHVTSLIKVGIGDDVIHVTEEHPFWVVGEGWRGAGSLLNGDCVQTRSGGCQPVVSARHVPTDTWVYNLTVAEAHTYFVSDGEHLVHNQCRTSRPWEQAPQQRQRHERWQNKQPATTVNVDESDLIWESYSNPAMQQKTVLEPEDLGPPPTPGNLKELLAYAVRALVVAFGGK